MPALSVLLCSTYTVLLIKDQTYFQSKYCIMDIHVKAYLLGPDGKTPREIRCFIMEKDYVRCCEELRKKIICAFSNLKEQIIFAMFYKDADDDEVSFSTDEELWMALLCRAIQDGTFRVYIKEMRGIKSWTFLDD